MYVQQKCFHISFQLLKNSSNTQGNDSIVELNIVKQELAEQDKLIDLLKQEIGSQNM